MMPSSSRLPDNHTYTHSLVTMWRQHIHALLPKLNLISHIHLTLPRPGQRPQWKLHITVTLSVCLSEVCLRGRLSICQPVCPSGFQLRLPASVCIFVCTCLAAWVCAHPLFICLRLSIRLSFYTVCLPACACLSALLRASVIKSNICSGSSRQAPALGQS